MALDGITLANAVYELNNELAGGKINKIAQPEPDALLLTCRGRTGNVRLYLSASPSLPLLYVAQKNMPSPMTAPNFCMLLRKHIGNGIISSIRQPGLERIIEFTIDHLNELGDPCQKLLIIEFMGKHSNIIFCHMDRTIIDSIKHISSHMSSVREVLPGRPYFIPQTQDKYDPLSVTQAEFQTAVAGRPLPAGKALYSTLTGISPVIANEICFRSGVDPSVSCTALGEKEVLALYLSLLEVMEHVHTSSYAPVIIFRNDTPVEYAPFPLRQYTSEHEPRSYPSISAVLEYYYAAKDQLTRMRQKSTDLRKIVQTALERSRKKFQLQKKQYADTEKRDTFKIYGELLHSYGYGLEEGAKSLEALNYYTNEMIRIPLDATLSAQENAQRYFDRYNKLKRTQEALTIQLEETRLEIEHLESIQVALSIAADEHELAPLKEELTQAGYIKRKGGGRQKKTARLKPLHFISSDGYDIYVGKNNYQNEEITFKLATGNDWWFHAKGLPGSHVIIKCNNEEPPVQTFEEAGALAAYYSSAKEAPKVEIDYIQRKHVKKPAKANPGFVVYYTNYSLMAAPDISNIKQANDTTN
ncbi:MAG: NFACT family protein [Lachnospiraceae bacterium]